MADSQRCSYDHEMLTKFRTYLVMELTEAMFASL